jgi:membrane-bound lytic murein transglycosylase F
VYFCKTIVERKEKRMKKLLYIIIPLIFVVWLSSKWLIPTHKTPYISDYNNIVSRGKLIVATTASATDYFVYNGEPKGFQFELLEELGNYLGLKVEIIVNNDPSKNIKLLKNGECDLIASSWGYSKSLDENISFSVPLIETNLVLVQRKPTELLVNSEKIPDKLIRNPSELEGKSIYIPVESVEEQLTNDVNFIKDKKIQIYKMAQYSQEKLISMVATGDIDYTICNNILARSLKKDYPELDFETVVKNIEPIVWNFRKTSPVLTEKINKWIENISGTMRFAILTNKYYNNRERWFPAEAKYNPTSSGKISDYDDLIRKYSQNINWDWRLLASLIYQESRFKPDVRSKRGAWGLMQMMPTTQSYFGIDNNASPEMQIKAGVRYIKFLDNAFASKIEDPRERIHFILASYNIGPGHIFDAQIIARKSGKDPLKWFNNVDSCLMSKSQPKTYNDPDIQHGYCKGTETYNFVMEIINRYNHYRNVLN